MNIISVETLAEWMDRPVDPMEVLKKQYEIPYSFHSQAADLYFNSTADRDRAASQMLERAAIAEIEDREPKDGPEWPCTVELCENNRENLLLDHEDPKGWVHGEPDQEC